MKARTVIFYVFILIVLWAIQAIIPFLIVFGLFLYFNNKKQPTIEQKPQKTIPQRRPIPQKEEISRDVIQATLEQVEDMLHNDEMMRKSFDLRQFRGRNDVTKEEVYEFMFNQRRWDGAYERHAYMEEIAKVSNLSDSDIAWVKEQLRGKACAVRNEEYRAVIEYQNEQGKRDVLSHIDWLKQTDIVMNEIHTPEELKYLEYDVDRDIRKAKERLKKYDYEYWLKEKGYANNY